MASRKVTIDFQSTSSAYQIRIGEGSLGTAGVWARECIGGGCKLLIVSDPAVFKLYGRETIASLSEHGFEVSQCLLKQGESNKNMRSAAAVLKAAAKAGLTRTDGVVALGGGVVGDVAGFAASIYLRGVAYLQMPTTLLSMIDSSVGGKTGVNSDLGKNLIGSFYQPNGVLVDVGTLKTLPLRELRSGFYEVVKHGAIGGERLLWQTSELLAAWPPEDLSQGLTDQALSKQLCDLVEANVLFKARVVAGDERESVSRTDARSRKILNFGHTLAHAIENVTDYKLVRHGEAVGYGIMFAAEISKSLALCAEKDVKLLNDVLHRVGRLPSLADIDPNEVLEAFTFDKKSMSGELQMVLLKGIGKPVMVSANTIPRTTLLKTLKKLLRK